MLLLKSVFTNNECKERNVDCVDKYKIICKSNALFSLENSVVNWLSYYLVENINSSAFLVLMLWFYFEKKSSFISSYG